jgi:hypothetical protein
MYKLANTLNFQKLEGVSRKIQAMGIELELILSKNKELLNNNADLHVIEELYEKYLQIQKFTNELPLIIERLEALKVFCTKF